jgi:hypothetical protein
MEQQQKLKHYKRKKLQKKSVTTITLFIEMYTNGLISALTTSAERAQNGTQKSVNKFLFNFKNTIVSQNNP